MIEIKEKIGLRIREIVNLMPSVANVADIGCDHGLTGLLSLSEKKAIQVIATDISEPSLRKAYDLAEEYGLMSFYDFRLGDGLSVIDKDEVDAVIISGIGGELMRNILEAGKSKISNLTKLVLSPNNREDVVRSWLYFAGFVVEQEKIIEENGKFYQIFTAKMSPSSIRDISDTKLGTHMVDTDQSVLKKYYDYKIKNLNETLNNLQNANDEQEKIDEVKLAIAMYEDKKNGV
ncbi:MAG: class I SAM-dependent methyltransferase [Eubacteriales bacterium]